MPQLADLYLLGAGFGPLRQLTAETRDVIRRCRVVFHLTNYDREFRRLNPNTVDLSDMYWTNDELHRVYRKLGERIFSEVEKGSGVASIGEGHPLVFDDSHHALIRKCRRLGYECKVLPAVSCLDTICIDLGIDYAYGLQVLEASIAVDERIKLNPSLQTLLLQVGEFGTDVPSDRIEDDPDRYKPLERYLKKFFPADHRVVVCFTDPIDGNHLARIRINRLSRHRRSMFPGTTMYLPPLG